MSLPSKVGDHNGIARIEVGNGEREKFFDKKVMTKVGKKLRYLGFNFVTLDFLGYQQGLKLTMVIKMKRS